MVFAVNTADAMPVASVGTVMVLLLLLKVPEDPVDGAVKTTLAAGRGLPNWSLTVTLRGMANAVLMFADCRVVPGFVVMAFATPGLLVSEKLTAARLLTFAV